MSRVRVLLLQHGVGAFDYAVPDGLHVQPGDVVAAPLGPRTVMGVVWDALDGHGGPGDGRPVPDSRLRAIKGRLDVPPIDAALRRLIDWVADYYVAPPASVLRMAMPSPSALEPPRAAPLWRLVRPVDDACAGRSPQRRAALARLAEWDGEAALPMAEWARLASATPTVVRALAQAGAFVQVSAGLASPPLPRPDHAPPALSDAQRAAAAELTDAVRAGGFSPMLLDGVTGAGKTEVYFEAVAEALRHGGQTLVLLPEIALTQPWLKRFEARFGVLPTVWHSSLKPGLRRAAWRAATNGTAKVVVGARSALFLPMPDLKLIVVDEAHDGAFKQEEGVQYHARDVAVMRAQFAALPVILSTATPSLETQEQVLRGRYRRVALAARHGGATMPAVQLIDMRRTPPPRGRWLAPPLTAAVESALAGGEQALLFLNRRGYAPLTLCRSCGDRIECPNCTAWMVEHRLTRRLLCHHCGHETGVPETCPTCQADHSLVACGPGVERLAEEVKALWPHASVAQVTSDSVRTPEDAAALVRGVTDHDIDILIGTQMVTKGYDFPLLTLVGVVDADLGLAGGDLRAGERTFQQIAQVAGRAGRGSRPGRVLVQTHQPDAPIMRAIAAQDRDGFYAAERAARERHAMPPFGRLAALVVSSEDAHAAAEAARQLGAAAPAGDGVEVWGPAPAPLAMLRGRHRHRLLAHASRGVKLQRLLRDWVAQVKLPASVRLTVDVDPHSFL